MRVRVLVASLVMGSGFVLMGAPGAQALSCVMPQTVVSDASELFYAQVVAVEDGQVQVEPTEYLVGTTGPDSPTASNVQLKASLFETYGPAITVGEEWLMAPQDGSISPCSAWPVGNGGVERAEVKRWLAEAGNGPVLPSETAPGAGLAPEPGMPTPAMPEPGTPEPAVADGSTAIPSEPWNAETNPSMATLAARAQSHDRSAGELAGWAGLGVLVGVGVLVGLRRRLS